MDIPNFNQNKMNTNFMQIINTNTTGINDFVKDIGSIMNLILAFIGVIGNLLCIYIFSQKQLKKNIFNWYLLALAIFEFIFCFIIFMEYLFRVAHPSKFFLHELNKSLNVLIDFSFRTADSYIILITLLLSIDRLYAIKNPLNLKNFITHLHPKLLMILTLVSLVSLEIVSTTLRHLYEDLTFYISMVTPIIFNIIPTIIILVVNSLLIKEIVSYYKKKSIVGELPSTETVVNTSKNHLNNNRKESSDFKLISVPLMWSCNRDQRTISATQKSHYFTLIVLALWLVLTTIPYCVSNSLYLVKKINKQSENFEIERVSVESHVFDLSLLQFFSSILFNWDFFLLKLKKCC